MTIQAANRPSVAETQLIDAYSAVLGELPGEGAVLSARDILFDDLKKAGLPTRRIESWHYTDLKALLRAVPDLASQPQNTRAKPALVEGASLAEIHQGRAGRVSALGEGVTLTAYVNSLNNGTAAESLVARDGDDAIGRINGSFVRDGFQLDIADETELAAPLEFQLLHGGGHAHQRLPARFGKGVKASIVERHFNTSEQAGFVSTVRSLSLEEGADVLWVILQNQGLGDTHLGQTNVTLGTGSKLRLYVINAGGKLVREEIHVVTAGEGSDFTLRGVNLLGGESHTDVTMTLGHDVPNTTSTEIIRNVVFDRARGVFQGQIRVAPAAQKTDARMACNTLLMSDDAEFSVKPELEIFADDVQCAHGATVTDILKTHLYYLMSRGIPEKKARGLLINAFVAEIVEELEDEALVEALEGVISNWLEAHG